MNERAFHFGESGQLVGVLTPVAAAAAGHLPTFVILNSGLIHRVGPNRLSVRIARALAEIGYACFRIDISGIGDSPARQSDDRSILQRWVDEARSAMDFLSAEIGAERFVFLGNCSGAGLSFFSALSDPRIVGTVLINLQGDKKLMRYFWKLATSNLKIWRRLASQSIQVRDFWANARLVFRKKVDRAAGIEYDRKDFLRDLKTLVYRGVRIVFIYSEWDPGYAYFESVMQRAVLDTPKAAIETRLIHGINHDFNLINGQNDLIDMVTDWARRNIENLKSI
jgi:pimeloyl-ACP methyl ester carboxylesterase